MIELPRNPIVGMALAAAVGRNSDAIAYIDDEKEFTFADVEAISDQLASGLLELGLERGDRIGINALNQIEWVLLFFAAAKLGIAVVGLNTRYRDSEIEYMMNDSQMKAVFTIAQHEGFDFLAMLERLRPSTPELRLVIPIDITVDGVELDYAALLHSPMDEEKLVAAKSQVRSDDLAMVIYTSGTTGRPKGTALSQRSLLASADAQAAHVRVRQEDLLQLAVPLNHVGGITCGILTLLLGGGTCELVPAFKADVVLDLMRRRPPTLLSGVPTMLALLLMHPRSEETDLSSVRIVIVGGSSVDDTLLTRIKQRMPQATIMNLYGLSESSGAIVMTPWGCSDEDLMTSIGRPLAGAEVRVVTDDGREAALGEVGELCFRGLGVVSGYIGAAAGKSPVDANGWLQTGDLGEVDERGYIRMRGRMSDMYIQGGYNVYPAEVEEHIARHPDVVMVAGIGVPDPVMGEIGRYYIVRRPDSSVSEREILTHCAGALADYKVPRQIVFRDDLPLTPAGKIQKAALRTEAATE